MITSDRSFSHEELSATADRVAGALGGLGVEPGQRVSLYSQNRWEWIVAYHGALRLGAVVNPLNVMLTPPEVAFAAQDCGASLVIGSPDRIAPLVEIRDQMPSVAELVSFDEPPAGALGFDALLEGAPAAPERELPAASELCSIGYTSGTTGHPKGAMQTHGAVALNCGLTATMHVRNAADVMLTALPAPHVYGNVAINGTLLAGGTVVLMDRFDPGLALALIAEHGSRCLRGFRRCMPRCWAAPRSSALI